MANFTKQFKSSLAKGNVKNPIPITEAQKVQKAPNSLGTNIKEKRAIYLTVKSDDEVILNSFFVYSNQVIAELKQHNKNNKVTSQSSVDTLLEQILPQSVAFIQDRLNIGTSNPIEVEKHIVGQLMYAAGSLTMANQYWSMWGSTNDAVFNLTITIDSDGFIGVNSYKNTEGQVCSMAKGIDSRYNEVKSKCNLVSFS